MRHVALLLLWPLAASAQTAKPEESSAIEGRVLNAATGEPVAKASLRLTRTDSTQPLDNWARSYAASSDSTGKFAIRNIDPGKYRLRASRNGFVALEYGARASQRSGTVLDLDRPQQLKDVDLRLSPHGVITGRRPRCRRRTAGGRPGPIPAPPIRQWKEGTLHNGYQVHR